MASLLSQLPFLDIILPGFAQPILTVLTTDIPVGKILPFLSLAVLLFHFGKSALVFLSAWINFQWSIQPAVCTIPSSDPSFDIFMWWVARQSWVMRAPSVLATCTPTARTGYFIVKSPELSAENYETPFSFCPYEISVPFWWRGRLFLFERNGQPKTMDPMALVIRCLGSVSNIHDLLEECRHQYSESREKCSVFHHVKGEWQRISNLKPRPLSTIVLPAGVGDQLVGEIQEFFSAEYRDYLGERGLPLRKGYLLHGPPGTGKSSLPQALANEQGLNVYVVDLLGLDNEQLLTLFRNLPEKCIVLIEDIDDWQARSESRLRARAIPEEANAPLTPCVSMSALLNVIDGVSAREGRVLFVTTNRRDELDVALTRKGRIDREIRLGEADQDMARQLFLLVFGSHGKSDEKAQQELAAKADRFGAQVLPHTYTPAQIINSLMENRHSADVALKEFVV